MVIDAAETDAAADLTKAAKGSTTSDLNDDRILDGGETETGVTAAADDDANPMIGSTCVLIKGDEGDSGNGADGLLLLTLLLLSLLLNILLTIEFIAVEADAL